MVTINRLQVKEDGMRLHVLIKGINGIMGMAYLCKPLELALALVSTYNYLR